MCDGKSHARHGSVKRLRATHVYILRRLPVVNSLVHPKGHRPDPPLQGSWGAGKASEREAATP